MAGTDVARAFPVVEVSVYRRFHSILTTLRKLSIGQIIFGIAITACGIAIVDIVDYNNSFGPAIPCGIVVVVFGIVGVFLSCMQPRERLQYHKKFVCGAVIILSIICFALSVYLLVSSITQFSTAASPFFNLAVMVLAVLEGIFAVIIIVWCSRIMRKDFGFERGENASGQAAQVEYPGTRRNLNAATKVQSPTQQQYLQAQAYTNQSYAQPYYSQQAQPYQQLPHVQWGQQIQPQPHQQGPYAQWGQQIQPQPHQQQQYPHVQHGQQMQPQPHQSQVQCSSQEILYTTAQVEPTAPTYNVKTEDAKSFEVID